MTTTTHGFWTEDMVQRIEAQRARNWVRRELFWEEWLAVLRTRSERG